MQAQTPVLRNFGPDEGLASSNVYCAFQDAQGFVWFGTETGVSRYDGYRFRNFTTADGLSDNEVFTIHEDSKLRLWFMTFNGRLSFWQNGKFYNAANQAALAAVTPPYHLDHFFEDPGGNLWFAARDVFTIPANMDSANVRRMDRKGRGAALKFFLNSNGELMGINRRGLTSSKSDFSVNIDTFPEILSGSEIAFVERKNGKRYFFDPSGPYEITDSRIVPLSKDIFPKNSGKVLAVMETEAGELWLGTENGAYRNAEGSLFSGEFEHFLPGIMVANIMEDREGNLWFSTSGNGVFFGSVFDVRTYSESLPHPGTYCFEQSTEGTVWIGGENGYFYAWNKGKLEEYEDNFLRENSGKGRITAILYDSQGQLWIGGDNGLICIYPDKRREYFFLSSIKSLLEKSGGEIWVNTSSGTMLLNRSNLEIFRRKHPGEAFQMLPVRAAMRRLLPKQEILLRSVYEMYFDSPSNLWLGSLNGLLRWNLESDSVFTSEDLNPVFSERINGIRLAQDGTCWVATHGQGLVRLKDGKTDVFREENGLSANICNAVSIDADGAVWVGTNAGLDVLRFHHGKPEIRNYTIHDGLVSNEINDLLIHGDTIWIATHRGLTMFQISRIPRFEAPPPVYLTGVRFGERDSLPEGHFTVPWSENNLQFNFVGISYNSGGELDYKYRLAGLDSAWSYTENTSVEFRALPPGDYSFEILARSSKGVWSDAPDTISFTVTAPFWRDPWYLTVFAIAGVLAAWLVFYLRLQAFRRREMLERRLVESEQKALRAQMNPHFIFNALNSVQKFFLKKQHEDGHDYLLKFSDLMRTMLENSDKSQVTVQEEIQSLQLYLEFEKLRNKTKFDFEIVVDPRVDVYNTWIPGLMLQPFLENAIWHGIMYKEKKGKISLEFRKNGTELQLIVDDDGVGREKAEALKSNFKRRHKSAGLRIVRERIEALNVRRKAPLKLEIIDKKDENGTPTGTRIQLTVPLDT